MTNRERFQAIMNFEAFDRLPVFEWAPWWEPTIERFKAEGMPTELETTEKICSYFGQDQYARIPIPMMTEDGPKAPSHGAPIIYSADEYHSIKKYLYPDLPETKKEEFLHVKESHAAGDTVVWFTMDGFFWFPRVLLGIENHLYAFYDQPELIHEINKDLSDWMLRTIDQICEFLTPDFMSFSEDMSYNLGPMLSEDLYREFLLPYYHKVVPALKERGIIPFIDSDGDISKAVPWFLESGIEAIFPLERQAGVDIVQLRRQYPKLRFMGCFDKMVLGKGEAALRAEFERMLDTAAEGGLLISCDHQTPPHTSLEEYKLYMKLSFEYAQKAGERSRQGR